MHQLGVRALSGFYKGFELSAKTQQQDECLIPTGDSNRALGWAGEQQGVIQCQMRNQRNVGIEIRHKSL